jgi:hypothetical protein
VQGKTFKSSGRYLLTNKVGIFSMDTTVAFHTYTASKEATTLRVDVQQIHR